MRKLLAVCLLLHAGWTLSQVQVVESEADRSDSGLYPTPTRPAEGPEDLYPSATGASPPPSSTTAPSGVRPVAQGSAAAGSAAPSGELFYQLQVLQEEVMQLRGLVEQHEQSIRRLKQQRLDDYMNLDRRIAEIGGGGAAAAAGGSSAAAGSAAPGGAAAASVEPTANEEETYRAAYNLVRERRFPEATSAFEAFLKQYPEGGLTPNAYYWLGELYLLEGNNEAARQRFETLLARYPGHRKEPDAMFKLAKVYHLEGRADDAGRLLRRVSDEHPGSSAARLANEYRQQNF